jgi:sporulation protein YabP
METSSLEQKKQSLTLSNRKQLSLDGVIDVKSFDDMLICLETNLGKLSIEGEGIRITKYLMNTGEMSVDGVINSIIYSDTGEEKKGLFSKFSR